MCVYCMISDWGKEHIPSQIPGQPDIWTRKMLDQFEDLLDRVKKLEDAAGGCPEDDPSKRDYLKKIRKILDEADGTPN